MGRACASGRGIHARRDAWGVGDHLDSGAQRPETSPRAAISAGSHRIDYNDGPGGVERNRGLFRLADGLDRNLAFYAEATAIPRTFPNAQLSTAGEVAISIDLPSADQLKRTAALTDCYLFDAAGRLVAAGRTDGAPADLGALVGREMADRVLADPSLAGAGAAFRLPLRLEGEAAFQPNVELRRIEGAAGKFILATTGEPPAVSGNELIAASRDAVTGLPDRRAIAAWAATRPSDGRGAGRPYAALFIDLDCFKQVNDRHSHAAGDTVLAELAARWSAAVRDRDLVVRYGGDEFVILLDSIADRAAAEPIVERLSKVTQQPIEWAGTPIKVAATIGVAVSESATPIKALVAAADDDMYAQRRALAK